MLPTQRKIISRDDAFEALFARYASGLLVYAREFVGTRQEAEDIVQDVFVKVWERITSLREDKVRSYLFRSTRNGCLNHIERLGVRSKYQEEVLRRGERPSGLDPDLYVADDLRNYIYKAVSRLPQQQRLAFEMCRFDGLTYAEIAARLDISPRTVEKHVEVASKTMRRELGKYMALMIMPVI